jgi:hypothetical protein
MSALALAVGFIVVLLDDLWVSGDLIEKDTPLQVDRALRNDWIGSKLARDATDEEVEKYRADEAEAAAEANAEAAEAAEKQAKIDAAAAKKVQK